MRRYYLRVRTEEQLETALQWGRASGLLLDYELAERLRASGKQGIILPVSERSIPGKDYRAISFPEEGYPEEIFYCLPDVTRQSGIRLTEQLAADCPPGTGLLIRNLDELGLLQDIGYQGPVIGDSFLYAYNSAAVQIL